MMSPSISMRSTAGVPPSSTILRRGLKSRKNTLTAPLRACVRLGRNLGAYHSLRHSHTLGISAVNPAFS